jgi:predicted lysophospholipase L1 biosynthesis ABC-type transport system permease subunit
MEWEDTLVAEIIGVVGDVRIEGPETEPREAIYWHHLQFQTRNVMNLLVRTDGDPAAYAGEIRAAVHELDPSLPIYNLHPMTWWMSETLASRRFAMLSLGTFAALALILAAIGVYGVMAYAVGQRRREFGIRLALGASGRSVTLGVVGGALRLIVPAVVVGGLGALLLARLLDSMVYGVSTTDPVSFVLAALFLVAVGALASYRPAHRAGKVDPMEALRFD